MMRVAVSRQSGLSAVEMKLTRGFSIVEGLIATAVLSTAILGTASLASYLYASSHRSQVLNRAISVQTELVNALLNKEQYAKGNGRDALIDRLAAGGSPVGLRILSDPGNANSRVLAIVGQRSSYALDGTDATCTQDCPITVDVDFNCANLGAQGCMVAYRVSITPEPSQVTPAPLGAMPGPAANPTSFRASDYSMGLPHDFFTQKLVGDCGEDNVAGDHLLMTGMDRTSGQVSCISKQVTACAAPTIAHGVGASADGRQLELKCHPLSNVRCPANYVLQQFDYGQLDAGADAADPNVNGLCGVCVYRWATDIAWQGPAFRTGATSSSASYTATVCEPSVYDAEATGSCNVVWDSNPPVVCDATTTIYASATASGTGPGADNRPSCTVTVTQNSCAGGTTSGSAHGEWSGVCRVKERRTNASLVLPPVNGSLCGLGPSTPPTPPTPPLPPTPNPIAGVCGSANGAPASTAPTTNKCTAGMASANSGSGPWTWTCAGQNGGATANCSTTLRGPAIWKYLTGGWNESIPICPGANSGNVGFIGQPCSPLGNLCKVMFLQWAIYKCSDSPGLLAD